MAGATLAKRRRRAEQGGCPPASAARSHGRLPGTRRCSFSLAHICHRPLTKRLTATFVHFGYPFGELLAESVTLCDIARHLIRPGGPVRRFGTPKGLLNQPRMRRCPAWSPTFMTKRYDVTFKCLCLSDSRQNGRSSDRMKSSLTMNSMGLGQARSVGSADR